jgi:hypothetical protein
VPSGRCGARGVSFLSDSLGLVTLLLYVAGETGQALAVALLLLVGDFAPSLLGPFTGVLSGLWGWGSFTLSGGRGIEAYERTATVLQPGWYAPVRNGHKSVSNVPKTAQISAISGRTSTY